jgi:hypothetical protein
LERKKNKNKKIRKMRQNQNFIFWSFFSWGLIMPTSSCDMQQIPEQVYAFVLFWGQVMKCLCNIVIVEVDLFGFLIAEQHCLGEI